MIIKPKMINESDVSITTMDTPHGYHDYMCIDTGEQYRVAIDCEPTNTDDEWLSISLEPMVYPIESVRMAYGEL